MSTYVHRYTSKPYYIDDYLYIHRHICINEAEAGKRGGVKTRWGEEGEGTRTRGRSGGALA